MCVYVNLNPQWREKAKTKENDKAELMVNFHHQCKSLENAEYCHIRVSPARIGQGRGSACEEFKLIRHGHVGPARDAVPCLGMA